MKFFKKAIRSLARRSGYDLVRLRKNNVGVNPVADMQRFLRAEQKPVIFDVGANIGQSVDKFGKAFPKASLHSFEPSPTTYAKLKQYCDGLPGVKTWNYGVGSRETTLTFHENTHPEMSSFLPPSKYSWGEIVKTTEVPVVTLDSFAKQNQIDFVHILKSDTQGYDFEVFKGAGGLMDENKIALIYFEFIFSDMYKDLPPFHEVLRYLSEKNFALVAFYESYFQKELISWTDALFINRDYNAKIAVPDTAPDAYAPRTNHRE